MAQKKRQPKWWQVYIMLPLLVGLFYPEMQLPLTQTEHTVAELGILALIYVCMQLWMRANRSALMQTVDEEGYWRINVFDLPPEPMHEPVEGVTGTNRPMLQIPAAGLKGVLSDTFEWEAPEDETSVFAHEGAEARKEQR